jgi:hypothetical protein
VTAPDPVDTPTTPTIRLADEAPSGLASMLGDLLGQNLARHPERNALLEHAVSSIEAPDADVAVTITLTPLAIVVAGGVDGRATVHVRAPSDRLLALVASPLRFGLPDVFSAEGRAVVTDLLRGRLRVRGLVRHPGQVARLTRLLSVRDDRP